MNRKTLILLGFVVVIVLVGILLFTNVIPFPKGNTPPTPTPKTSQIAPTRIPATFTYTKNGFVPKTATVNIGETFTVTNESGATMSLNSADHPSHVRFPELNVGTLTNGATGQIKFDKKGAYSFHDHYKPENTGTITVK